MKKVIELKHEQLDVGYINNVPYRKIRDSVKIFK